MEVSINLNVLEFVGFLFLFFFGGIFAVRWLCILWVSGSMKNKYILGTDTFDNKVFSVCLFDAENNTIVTSESIFGKKNLKKE